MDINKLNDSLDDLNLHHVGFVCENIQSYKKYFLFLSNSNDFDFTYDDVQQNVRAGFIKLRNNTYIELLEELDKKSYSPIANFVSKNVSGYHHICYETQFFEDVIKKIKILGFRLISRTINGFENREVAFFIPKKNPDGPLLEIVTVVDH